MAPEVIVNKSGYDDRADIWSIGVILYQIISGILPYSGKTVPQLIEKLNEGNLIFDGDQWGKVSQECKDFITDCLTQD